MYPEITQFIRKIFNQQEAFIPLHSPCFKGNEEKYVLDTIRSTYVSSVGAYVTKFEEMVCEFTGARYAIAIVNGTSALHLALLVSGVGVGDEVITQPLTFVATANAIVHAGGEPVFVDVDKDSLGMSPDALRRFLEKNAEIKDGQCRNRRTGRRIAACLPMHTFGLPMRIKEVSEICNEYGVVLVEDAAESIGSYYRGKHTGAFGKVGVFSFNGNKTITCGGGGMVVTNDSELAQRAKHLSTTAKLPHSWEFVHDRTAYNYRLPNINAALACAQMEQLDSFLESKRAIAEQYKAFFSSGLCIYVEEIEGTKSNYWLNAILFKDKEERDGFLEYSNSRGVMTRPAWKLLNKLTMYSGCLNDGLPNAEWLEERLVNIPSSAKC